MTLVSFANMRLSESLFVQAAAHQSCQHYHGFSG